MQVFFSENSSPRRGAILPAVLLFVIFSLAMGMAILELGTAEERQAVRRQQQESGFYLAEGGLNYAFAYLESNPDWNPADHPVNERSGFENVRIDIENSGESGSVVSSVETPGGETLISLRQILEFDIRPVNWAQGFGWLNPDIEDKTNYVTGSVIPEDALHYRQREDFPDQVKMPPRNWTSEGYSPLANQDGKDLHFNDDVLTLPPGDHKFRNLHVSGGAKVIIEDGARVYITGDIQLPSAGTLEIAEAENEAEKKGVDIFVDDGGRIQLPGDVVTLSQDPADLRIYSNSGHAIGSEDSEVKFPSHAEFYGLIYAPDAEVDLVNHTKFYGSILADTIRGRNHTDLEFDEDLADFVTDDVAIVDSVKRGRWSKVSWENRFED